MFCNHCNILMQYVMSFCDGKAYKFYRCSKCWYETKRKPLIFNDKEINQENTEIKTVSVFKRKGKKKPRKDKSYDSRR